MSRPGWAPPRLTTKARLEPCGRCNALVLRALDAPVAGIDVRCDPTPLDLVAEIRARMADTPTYDLINVGLVKEIAFRDEWRIKKRKWPVLPKHRCPGPISTKALYQARQETKRTTPDNPPF